MRARGMVRRLVPKWSLCQLAGILVVAASGIESFEPAGR